MPNPFHSREPRTEDPIRRINNLIYPDIIHLPIHTFLFIGRFSSPPFRLSLLPFRISSNIRRRLLLPALQTSLNTQTNPRPPQRAHHNRRRIIYVLHIFAVISPDFYCVFFIKFAIFNSAPFYYRRRALHPAAPRPLHQCDSQRASRFFVRAPSRVQDSHGTHLPHPTRPSTRAPSASAPNAVALSPKPISTLRYDLRGALPRRMTRSVEDRLCRFRRGRWGSGRFCGRWWIRARFCRMRWAG